MKIYTTIGYNYLVNETILEPKIDNTGNHDKFSHYVHKDDLMRGLVFGEMVMALCGKIWVPTEDGMKYPMCSRCKDIFYQLPK